MGKLITIVGMKHYKGDVLDVGDMVLLQREIDNEVDLEAVSVHLEKHSLQTIKVGHVANSVDTVIRGTSSAGNICDEIDEDACAIVKLVINKDRIVAEIVEC